MPRRLASLIALLLAASDPASASWPTDPATNLPVCVATGEQGPPRAASDGAGGAVIAWLDQRAGGQIFAQHLSADGALLWAEGGIALAPPGATSAPLIAGDGAGNTVIAWVEDDGTTRTLKAQRLNAAGIEQWTTGGVTLRQRVDQPEPNFSIWLWDQFSAAPDGAGGMHIAFAERHDEDNALDPSRYTSELRLLGCDATGAVVVERALASDQYICNHCGDGFFHLDELTQLIVAPGAPSGVVVAFRARPIINHFTQFKPPEIRVQEPITGLAATVVTAVADVRHPRVASDGAGGAIVSWEDTRSGAPRLYAARLTGAGALPWVSQGLAVSAAAGDQFSQEMVAHDGGVGLVWLDRRNASVPDLYTQALDGSGAPRWPADVALCTQPTLETEPALARAADGSLAFAWRDTRSGSGDVYTRFVSPSGVAYGSADGDVACAAAGDQSAPAVVATGTQAILAWTDRRSGGADIYAQRIGYGGPVSGVPQIEPGGELAFARVAPNPASESATISLALPREGAVTLRVFDVRGQLTRILGPIGRAPGQVVQWNLRDQGGRNVPNGLYWIVLDAGGRRLTRRLAVIR